VSRFNSLLLPLDGSPEAAKGIGTGLWLAHQLGATLHVVHATEHPLPARVALSRLGIPEAQRDEVVIHQPEESAEVAVLEALREHRAELVVMSARGASVGKDGLPLGSVAREVLSQCPVPVLLLPLRYREVLPWTSMLAAASGEAAGDKALASAVRLAGALGLEVTVLHSADDRYVDSPHHELPRRLQEMVTGGVATADPQEARCVSDVVLRQGDPAAALLEEAVQRRSSVLALGWHGALAPGRARVLKRLLEQSSLALLVTRAPEVSSATLKVGSEIDGD